MSAGGIRDWLMSASKPRVGQTYFNFSIRCCSLAGSQKPCLAQCFYSSTWLPP